METKKELSSFRRPLKTRGAAWAQAFAAWICRRNITPNQISVLSVFVASIGAAAIFWGYFLLGALFIQLRLLCNLLDGMVAVEGGKKTPSGELYNDFPDRISDVILIVSLGYAASSVSLGWLGAILAILTAYMRLLAVTAGAPMDFRGPMAKPHRMALMTIGLLVCSGLSYLGRDYQNVLFGTLVILCLGCALTLVRRTLAAYAFLKKP